MQRLEPESGVDEEPSEVVEEFRVRRPVRRAEVVEGLDDAATEVLVPDAVDRGACELQLLCPDDPVREDLPAARSGRDLGFPATEEARRHRLLRHWVLNLAVAVLVPDPPVLAVAVLDARAGHEGRKAVEIVLCKVFQRMVVALGALKPLAQKQTRDGGNRLFDLELLEHEVDRRVPEVAGGQHGGVALGGEHRTDGVVIRPVLSNRVVKPALERAVGATLRVVLGIAEPVLELHEPVGGVLVPVQQSIDECGPLVGIGVREELPGLPGCRKDARRVQMRPAQERPVVGHGKGLDVDVAELAEDMLVDQVRRLRMTEGGGGGALDDDELRRCSLAHGPCRDGGHAGVPGDDQAVPGHCDDRLVVDRIAHLARHVASRAVGQAPDDDDRLLRSGTLKDLFGGMHLESLQPDAGRAVRRSLPHPLEDRRELVRFLGHQLSAAVGDSKRRLGKQQGFLGGIQGDPAALVKVDDHVVVKARIRAVEGQPESVLSGGRAVARGGIAALCREDGEQVTLETDTDRCSRFANVDRGFAGAFIAGRGDAGSAGGAGDQSSRCRVDGHHVGVTAGHRAARTTRDDNALGLARTLQADAFRLDQD